MSTSFTSIGLDAPDGSQRTVNNPVANDVKQAISQVDGVHVSDLMLEIEEGERYLTVQCDSSKQCICSVQDGETVYMLKNSSPPSSSPFPDYPIEYCVPLKQAVQACNAYAERGIPCDDLEWDRL